MAYDATLPRTDGGKEVVRFVLPPLMRRYQLATLYTEARGDRDHPVEVVGDEYMMQALFHSAVGLCWEGGVPGLPGRASTDLVAYAEKVCDALDSADIDVMSPAYYEVATEVFGFVMNSIQDADETAEVEAASEVFPSEEARPSSDAPSSGS